MKRLTLAAAVAALMFAVAPRLHAQAAAQQAGQTKPDTTKKSAKAAAAKSSSGTKTASAKSHKARKSTKAKADSAAKKSEEHSAPETKPPDDSHRRGASFLVSAHAANRCPQAEQKCAP